MLCAAALAALAAASDVSHVIVPKGIAEVPEYPYMAAILQALFWIPEIRAHVLAPLISETPNKVHLALAQLFMNMQMNNGEAASLDKTLVPVMEQMLSQMNTEAVDNVDMDADIFLEYLDKHILSTMGSFGVGTRLEQQGFVEIPGGDGIALKMAAEKIPSQNILDVDMQSYTNEPVHDLLTPHVCTTVTFAPERFNVSYHAIDRKGMKTLVYGKLPLRTVTEELMRQKVDIGTDVKVCYKRSIPDMPSHTLLVKASMFVREFRTNRKVWHSRRPTVFEHKFEYRQRQEYVDNTIAVNALFGAE